MSHTCHYRECKRQVKAQFLMCPRHWIQTPPAVREALGRLDIGDWKVFVSVDPAGADLAAIVWGVCRGTQIRILGECT